MVLTPDFDSRPIISFQHVWKTYPTGTEALRDVNLVVPEGDFLFLYHAQVLIAHTDRLDGYKPMPDGLVRVIGLKLK